MDKIDFIYIPDINTFKIKKIRPGSLYASDLIF